MRGVRQVRGLVIAVLCIFLALDIAAAVLLLSPAGRSRSDRERARDGLRAELLQKQRNTIPARDMDDKLTKTREQIDGFYKSRLPEGYAGISGNLGKLAAANHVQIAAVRYQTKPAGVGGLERLELAVTVTGPYSAQMNFINALERDKTFFVLNQLNFGGAAQANTNLLKVDLHLETYLRNEVL
jgi:type IV pilus assembly protein PilO